MLNSSRLVLLASAAKTTASRERTGSPSVSKEEQSESDNKHETTIPQAAVEEYEEGYAEIEGPYDLEDIDEVLAELEGEGVDDSDSSDIVLTDSSAPSYAPDDRWEDVTKEICVDEELARLEGGGSEETNMPHAHG